MRPIYPRAQEEKRMWWECSGCSWMVDHDVLPREKSEEYYASYIAGIFRTVRFGVGEAHGQAEMMEFNYLSENGAIKRRRRGDMRLTSGACPRSLQT